MNSFIKKVVNLFTVINYIKKPGFTSPGISFYSISFLKFYFSFFQYRFQFSIDFDGFLLSCVNFCLSAK